MRNIRELLEASKDDLPSVYCDMDMVLCDFLKGAEKVIGMPFPLANKQGRWEKISDTKDFWANLEWMPGAKKIVQSIMRYDAHILSAYSTKDPNSQSGKMKWLSKNTDFKRGNIHLVQRAQKQAYAMTDGEPNVLIDDYIKNVYGVGYKFTVA